MTVLSEKTRAEIDRGKGLVSHANNVSAHLARRDTIDRWERERRIEVEFEGGYISHDKENQRVKVSVGDNVFTELRLYFPSEVLVACVALALQAGE